MSQLLPYVQPPSRRQNRTVPGMGLEPKQLSTICGFRKKCDHFETEVSLGLNLRPLGYEPKGISYITGFNELMRLK